MAKATDHESKANDCMMKRIRRKRETQRAVDENEYFLSPVPDTCEWIFSTFRWTLK